MENMQIVSASKKVEAQYVEMKVPLYSYGCEKKVKKALLQLKGKLSWSPTLYSIPIWYEIQGDKRREKEKKKKAYYTQHMQV